MEPKMGCEQEKAHPAAKNTGNRKSKFCKPKLHVTENAKRFASMKNRFHTSECTQSNQNK